MAVRYATTEDIPRIVQMARREHARSPWRDVPFDEAATAELVAGFVQGLGRTLLISDTSYLAGMVQPIGFSRKTVALEYAFYSEGHDGMDLLTKFEEWAQAMNAEAVVVHDYTGENRLAAVLARRRNYQPIGMALTRRTGVTP